MVNEGVMARTLREHTRDIKVELEWCAYWAHPQKVSKPKYHVETRKELHRDALRHKPFGLIRHFDLKGCQIGTLH